MKDPLAKLCSMWGKNPKRAQKRARLLEPYENTGMEAVRNGLANACLRKGNNGWHSLAIYLQVQHPTMWKQIIGAAMEKANVRDRYDLETMPKPSVIENWLGSAEGARLKSWLLKPGSAEQLANAYEKLNQEKEE